MYDVDTHSVRSGNYHTLTIVTPVAQGGGTKDYNVLINKPAINDIELVGNMSLADLGIASADEVPKAPLSQAELDDIVGD